MAIVQVTPNSGSWNVIQDGNQIGSFPTQQEAEQTGRQTAKQIGAEFQLHAEDGQIRQKDSYGNDPRSIQG